MTFQAREESRQLGEPVHLYVFRYGDTPDDYYAYTDAETNLTVAGVVYEAIPIDRGAITASGSLDKSQLELRTRGDIFLADLFRVYPPSRVVSVVIRQGHIDDPDQQFLVCWTGRILSCVYEGNEARFNCEPVSTSMRRPGLRRNYQYACPHALYGPQCQASMSAATTITSVAAASGITIQLASGWASADRKPKYVGGMVTWDGPGGQVERRMIIGVSGDTVQVNGLVRNLVVGQEIRAILGCNHRSGIEDDCIALHNNIHNYGGQPWIPTTNPIGQVNNFA